MVYGSTVYKLFIETILVACSKGFITEPIKNENDGVLVSPVYGNLLTEPTQEEMRKPNKPINLLAFDRDREIKQLFP